MGPTIQNWIDTCIEYLTGAFLVLLVARFLLARYGGQFLARREAREREERPDEITAAH